MASEAIINNLPHGWELTTLGEVCDRGDGDIQTGPFGSQLHASDYVPAGIPSIMPVNIGDNRIVEDGIARVSPQNVERLSRHKVRAGDIVYSRRGDVERRALVRPEQEGWLCGTGCLRVRLGTVCVDPVFASYYLAHPQVRAWIVRHAVGATMPNLNTEIMSALPIVVPPFKEQRAIAHVLGTLDDKIELNRRMNETLEAMARAIFKTWFVDFDPVRAKAEGHDPDLPKPIADLFPDSFEESELGKIPMGWKVRPLPDAIEVNPRRTLPKGTVSSYLDMKNMPTRGHSPDEVIGRVFGSGTKFTNGDTILARITPCLENGKTAFVDFLRDDDVGWGSTEYIVFHPKSPLPVEFGYYLARSDELRSFAIQNMTGTSGRQRVPPDCFNQYLLAVPPETIARRFGDFVRPLVRQISANAKQSKMLAASRDTLLPKLLLGEMRGSDAERIVRSYT